MDLSFYKDKRVLVTGHTGFKGTWLTKIRLMAGADVCGYSRCSEREPSLFKLSGVEKEITHVKGNVQDYVNLQKVFTDFRPEIVFHLAAQPIVRESYVNPLETYATNVMGTANVLECIRHTDSVQSAVIVTTDKVYRNDEQNRAFREGDVLDGFDPYSNSKSCAELVTATYRRSFPSLPPISTARAGNVIGGGDFAKDRIIPDCVRAVSKGEPIIVRNPHSVRPYQHVLEPLFAYLLIAEKQAENPGYAGAYNVGPDEKDTVTTGEIADLFAGFWGEGLRRVFGNSGGPHEAGLLMLDSSRIRSELGWQPAWDIREAVRRTVEWSKYCAVGGSPADITDRQIEEYFG